MSSEFQNAAVQLVPSNNFPVCLKNKAAYFVKKEKCVITKDNISRCIIFGDMATKLIEHLAVLVDEVLSLLLYRKCQIAVDRNV